MPRWTEVVIQKGRDIVSGGKTRKWEGDLKPEDRRYNPPPGENPLIIAVMGTTGVGKSTYVNALLGRDEMVTSNSLGSCTRELQWAVVPLSATPLGQYSKYQEHRDRTVLILDTPGFNDNEISDTEILRRIAVWLADSFAQGTKVTGLVVLHDMNQSRMGGMGKQHIDIIHNLIGKRGLHRTIIGQTQWERVMKKTQEVRNKELRENFYKPMLDGNATMLKIAAPPGVALEDDSDSSGGLEVGMNVEHWRQLDFIIQDAVRSLNPTLQIQDELVKRNKPLEATKAAGCISRNIISPG